MALRSFLSAATRPALLFLAVALGMIVGSTGSALLYLPPSGTFPRGQICFGILLIPFAILSALLAKAARARSVVGTLYGPVFFMTALTFTLSLDPLLSYL